MFNNRRLTVLIITALAMVSVSHSRAANVIDMRSNSEADKTRLVVELDGPAKYEAHYTSEPGISIYLLETRPKSGVKSISIGDELVKTVALKETMDNIVEVNVSLKSGAAFTIFPLEAPDRIVVDVTSGAATGIPHPLNVPASGSETMAAGPLETPETPEAPGNPEDENVGTIGQSLDTRAAIPPAPVSVFPLQSTDYMLAQLCFNAFLVVALIVMGIKLWRVARISKRNLNALKENAVFADMIDSLQLDAKSESGAQEQRALPISPENSSKTQRKRKRKARATRPTEDQKQYEKVHKLAQLGMDRMEISQQSNVPIGEVNLILNLTKARSQAQAN